MDTNNIKRIRETITTPDTSKGTLPGDGKPIVYNRFVGTSASQGVLGWDAGATPRSSSSKVCEVCHTYDATGANGTKAHPYTTGAALGNHFGTDGTDCIRCHKHNKGFGVAGLNCTGCHGTPTDTITPDNRYVVAPPKNASGTTGALTGTGQVSNDPKVGAHQTHLRLLNGFTNYSTVDYRCQNCHGPVPTDFSHINGSSTPAFQGLATKGGMAPSYNSANLTCSNTYCHNPAASGVLKYASNTGTNVFPSWTSASYVANGTKTVANCSVCHKVPGVSGFQPSGTHAGMNTDTQDCSGCHGHNGDMSGALGRRHMDGILFGSGNCDSCHSYDTIGGTWGKTNYGGTAASEGIGAHAKHIIYIKARWGQTLKPATDSFGTGAAAAVCGVCHTNVAANHSMGDSTKPRYITFGESLTRQFGSSAPVYNGVYNTSSAVNPKTCSNVDCHYKQSPIWSTY
jgi:predicted CxxxxCH...CXXCH cytochrome family protein